MAPTELPVTDIGRLRSVWWLTGDFYGFAQGVDGLGCGVGGSV
jgi:hypothetical protein